MNVASKRYTSLRHCVLMVLQLNKKSESASGISRGPYSSGPVSQLLNLRNINVASVLPQHLDVFLFPVGLGKVVVPCFKKAAG